MEGLFTTPEIVEPAEPERVRRATPRSLNERIDHEIAARVLEFAGKTNEEISARINELERTWDTERILQANAALLAGTGLVLGLGFNSRWLSLTGGVLAFLLQHAVQGWCPPLPLLRRLGVRNRSEIEREKYALKALRGDFDNIPNNSLLATSDERAQAALQAVGTTSAFGPS